MRNIPPLDNNMRRLVEDNISVVKYAISSAIVVNKSIFGFEYADLFQEGCIWLCKAATLYNPKMNVKFSTFATTVVINGLRTYCRLMCNKQKKMLILPDCKEENNGLYLENILYYDPIDAIISEIEISQMFETLKKQYTGSIRKGIEAMELKSKGYTGVDIADMYGVKPNLVGAWISKALRKLESNGMFIKWMDKSFEKMVS